jgi:hypothetical protein
MKNRWNSITAILSAALLALPCVSLAGKSDKGGGFGGKVTAIDTTAKTITVTHRPKSGGASKTYTVTDATRISVNGTDGKLADIQIGMKASITPGTPDTTAAGIIALTRVKKGSKGGGSPQSPQAAPTPAPAS